MSCEGEHEGADTWWEYDARSIPLCKVCNVCRTERLAQYRPEVLVNPNYDCDEEVESEEGVRYV